MSETTSPGEKEVVLTEERWKHIVARHPELEDKFTEVVETAENPDELYVDPAGAMHAVKRLIHNVSDCLTVVYRKEEDKVYIITAYCTSLRRKRRRYKRFGRLKPS